MNRQTLKQRTAVSSDMMNSIKICIAFVITSIFSYQNVDKAPVAKIKSDTALVLDLAIRTAFHHENLPGIAALKKHYHFGDTILFSSDTVPLSILPKRVDSLKFKVLSRKEMVLLMQTESDLRRIPNFLNIEAFEKNDTGYYVSLESLNCLASFDGGGKIGIYIAKKNDSFVVIKKMSSSIN